jgi:hypothetical protein
MVMSGLVWRGDDVKQYWDMMVGMSDERVE